MMVTPKAMALIMFEMSQEDVGSRSWTFLLINHTLFFCLVIQIAVWLNAVRDESVHKAMVYHWIDTYWHPSTFINACWIFAETKQWMRAQLGKQVMHRTKHVFHDSAQLPIYEMKTVSKMYHQWLWLWQIVFYS